MIGKRIRPWVNPKIIIPQNILKNTLNIKLFPSGKTKIVKKVLKTPCNIGTPI